MTPQYLTTAQAAAHLKVHPSRIKALCRAGRLRFVYFGRSLAIDPRSVAAYAASPRKAGRPPSSG